MKHQDWEFVGSIRLHDELDGYDLFAGVRIWGTDTECGISMNDGRGGPAEAISFTDPIARWVLGRVATLIRRRAYRRRRAYALPNATPSAATRLHGPLTPR